MDYRVEYIEWGDLILPVVFFPSTDLTEDNDPCDNEVVAAEGVA